MSFETTLASTLMTVCPRSYPDVAPAGVVFPYAIWQLIGGQSLYYLDNTPATRREHRIQVTVWSQTRLESLTLMRDIEAALVSNMGAMPQGEPLAAIDEAVELRGLHQDFVILFDR